MTRAMRIRLHVTTVINSSKRSGANISITNGSSVAVNTVVLALVPVLLYGEVSSKFDEDGSVEAKLEVVSIVAMMHLQFCAR